MANKKMTFLIEALEWARSVNDLYRDFKPFMLSAIEVGKGDFDLKRKIDRADTVEMDYRMSNDDVSKMLEALQASEAREEALSAFWTTIGGYDELRLVPDAKLRARLNYFYEFDDSE